MHPRPVPTGANPLERTGVLHHSGGDTTDPWTSRAATRLPVTTLALRITLLRPTSEEVYGSSRTGDTEPIVGFMYHPDFISTLSVTPHVPPNPMPLAKS